MSKTSESARRPTALVTGASGGIGLELARLFAADKYDLVLVARSEDKLTQIGEELSAQFKIRARVVVSDLARAGSPREIFAELEAANVPVDVLVNNAGFGSYGLFADADERAQIEMLQVNVVALTHLTKLFLPAMIARKAGRVMNVASTAAFQPGPLMAVYYASKAYVLSFSEALANELAGTNVTVTALCPGPTETGFVAAAGLERSKLFEANVMDARTVAVAGYRGMNEGKAVVIPGLRNSLMARAVSFAPRKLVTKVVRRVQETRNN
jgi:short-subunit dehydrogenase